jgi:hypothetical protein
MPTVRGCLPLGSRYGLCFAAAFVGLWLLPGCGDGDSAKPAPVDKAQMKKAQEHLGSYREQMIAANKGKTKAKAAEKPAK